MIFNLSLLINTLMVSTSATQYKCEFMCQFHTSTEQCLQGEYISPYNNIEISEEWCSEKRIELNEEAGYQEVVSSNAVPVDSGNNTLYSFDNNYVLQCGQDSLSCTASHEGMDYKICIPLNYCEKKSVLPRFQIRKGNENIFGANAQFSKNPWNASCAGEINGSTYDQQTYTYFLDEIDEELYGEDTHINWISFLVSERKPESIMFVHHKAEQSSPENPSWPRESHVFHGTCTNHKN